MHREKRSKRGIAKKKDRDLGSIEKKMSSDMQHAALKLKSLFDNINDMVIAVTDQGIIMDINKRVKDIFGYGINEFKYRYVLDLPVIRDEDKAYLKPLFKEVVRKGKTITRGAKIVNLMEFKLKHKNGNDVYVEVSTRLINMKTVGAMYVSIVRDITRRKESELELHELTERYKSIMASSNEGLILFDSDLNVIDVNDYLLKEFAAKREDVIGLNMVDLSLDVWENGRFNTYKKIIETGRPWVHEIAAPPFYGNRYLLIKAFKVGNGLAMIVSDRTKERENEKKLAESEEKFRVLYQAVQAGVMVYSTDGKVIHLNAWGKKLLEFDKEIEDETRPDDILQMVEKDGTILPGAKNPFFMVLRRAKPVYNVLRRVRLTSSGKQLWLMMNIAPKVDPDTKKVDEAIMTFVDFTERKNMEDALKNSEHKYRHLFSHCHLAIGISFVEDSRILMANKAMLDLMGYSIAETKNITVGDLIADPQDRAAIREILLKQGKLVNYAVRLKNKRGEVFNALVNVLRITIDGKEYFQTICQKMDLEKHG